MFESSLIDLEARKQPKRRRWLSLPLAVFLHVVGLTAFAFASYWSVGAVQEPQTNVAFIDVALPPPMIQRGGGVKPPKPPETRQDVKPPAPTTPVQPDLDRIPDKPRDPAPQDVVEDSSASPGTDPTAPPGPGDPNGDPNSHNEIGVTNGDREAQVPSSGDDLPIRLTAEMIRPQALRPIQPRYTESARRAGVQGTVVVEAIIDEKGNATNVRVLRGLPMGLDRSAVDAILQTPFKPALMGTRPVKVYYTLTVTFTIQR